MLVIGITGPSGAGKSLLSRTLTDCGAAHIDADAVYHSLLIPPSDCLGAIREAFGDGVMSPDGSMDRKKMSALVFGDPQKLALLNQTVLGYVLKEIRKMLADLASRGVRFAAVDAPTLIESGFHSECDIVISVLCPPELRIGRIMTRDGISREAAERRISAQHDDSFYRNHSTHILINNGDREQFFADICRLAERLGLPAPSSLIAERILHET